MSSLKSTGSMRILFVTSEIPYPPDNGVRIVSYNAMRLMAQQGHELALAVLSDPQDHHDTESRMAEIAGLCKITHRSRLAPNRRWATMLASLAKRRMYFMQRYHDKTFAAKLRELLVSFQPDVVHFDLIQMCQYRDCVPAGIGTVASINDSHALVLENLLEDGYYRRSEKLYREFELHLARAFERTSYVQFSLCHTMTEVDAAYLQKLNPRIRTVAIPNGVNTGTYYPNPKSQGDSNKVMFVGKLVGFNVASLQQFLEEGWRVVRHRCPQAILRVVGKVLPEAKRLFPLAKEVGGVEFAGYLDDLGEEYRSCAIAIAPVNKDCGILNKAIEALASGLCVVGFRKAFSGIPEAQSGTNCIGVDSSREMGEAICDLLANRDRMRTIQKAASKIGADHYSWESRQERYELMYQEAIDIAKGIHTV